MKPFISHPLSMISGLILTALVSSGALAADPAPTTAPVVDAAPVARSAPRVEIFEFAPVDTKATPADWMGRGIRENLQSDVSKTGAALVLPAHAAAATDDQIAAAKQDHADLAVTGTYQIVGEQIRVNAHLVDVNTNTAVGGFSATGAQRDLFQVEDALGEQLRRLLPRQATAAAAQPAQVNQQTNQQMQPTQQPSPTVIYQQAPTQIYSPPVVTYEPSYYPDYGYGDYGYGYGYGYPLGFYGGIGIYTGGYRGGYYGHEGFRGGVGGGGFRGAPAHAAIGGIRGGGGIRSGGGGGRR